MRLLGICATLVLVPGLVLTGCGGSTTQAAAHSSVRAAPYPGSGISGFQAADLTWISDQQGWALGVAPGCSGQRCATVLETTDGGRQWTTVTDLHACLVEAAPVGCPAGVPEVGHIRFANADVGYAYSASGGPYSLTANGGLSWTLQTGRNVSAIKVASGTAVRVSFSRTGCPGPCDWSIDQAALGENVWQTLYTAPSSVNQAKVLLLRQRPNDIYVASVGIAQSGAAAPTAQLVASSDGGATWQRHGDPCAASVPTYQTTNLAVAPGGVLVALCASTRSSRSGVVVSTDGGDHFVQLQLLPSTIRGAFTEVAATGPADIFAAVPGVELAESTNGGRRWAVAITIRPEPQSKGPTSSFLGFESPLVGRWIGPPDVLWTTTNGGATWSPRKF